jgi:GNAT superfamily N-acetyltransferase
MLAAFFPGKCLAPTASPTASSSMAKIAVRAVATDAWRTMRDVRLAALQDAPHAFGSSYQREVSFTQDDWLSRIARGANFLAYAGEPALTPVGIVGAFEPQPRTAELVSMWVHPQAREQGIGRALAETVLQWARAEGHHRVHLWVTETNDPARRLYEHCGFAVTGERKPLPSHPQYAEIGMARPT